MATTEPKAISMITMAASDPDALAGARMGRHGGGDRVPAERHLESRVGEALGHVDQVLGVGGLQVRGLLVELDDREGGVPVGGHLLGSARCQRAADPGHVRERTQGARAGDRWWPRWPGL